VQYQYINLAWLIPVLPAVAFILIVFVTKRLKIVSALVAIAAMLVSFAISAGILWEVLVNKITMEAPVEFSVDWLSVPVHIEAGVLIDPLTAVMLFVVTIIALLVEIYSIGYMHGDPAFSIFFSYLSLFGSSMLGLVIANNYFQMFFFWELVGLCSYLLIGFYFYKNSAADANRKQTSCQDQIVL